MDEIRTASMLASRETVEERSSRSDADYKIPI
jgi:hypothetical protein